MGVGEQILQLRRTGKAERLKAIARSPMSEPDVVSNRVRIEMLGSRLARVRVGIPSGFEGPFHLQPAEHRPARRRGEFDADLAVEKWPTLLSSRRLNLEAAVRPANDAPRGVDLKRLVGPQPQMLHSVEPDRHGERLELKAQDLALDGRRQVGERNRAGVAEPPFGEGDDHLGLVPEASLSPQQDLP